MTDKWAALQKFWESFGLPAYDENTVIDGLLMPYITYQASINDFGEQIPLVASVWYYSTSWKEISQKVNEISEQIGGGMGIPYEGGRVWITKQTPFAQRLFEPTNNFVRRIVLQVAADFQ